MVSVSLAELLRWGNPHSWLPGALGSSSSPRRGLGAPFFVANLGTLTAVDSPGGCSQEEETPRLKLTSPCWNGGKACCAQLLSLRCEDSPQKPVWGNTTHGDTRTAGM
jgi:hypothetical protein